MRALEASPPEPVPAGATHPGIPIIFYTDLESAPPGAYLTIWGRGFGQRRETVLLGEQAVDRILRWTDDMIELKLPEAMSSGPLRVRAGGFESPPHPFRMHPGRLLFVSGGGDDGAAGSEARPFRSFGRVSDALLPGDVVYVRAGQYTAVHNFDAIWSFYDVRSGTVDNPIAVVGYPGEEATLGNNAVEKAFSFYRGDENRPLDYVTIAKLRLRPGCLGIPVHGMNHGRIVGNEVFGSSNECQDGVISLADGDDWKILGNYVHDNGNTKKDHGIYLAGFGTNRNVEVAWNRIARQTGGRGIQMYGHTAGDRIEHVRIHDNEIFEIDRDAILLGGSDADELVIRDVRIFNNVIQHAGRCVGWAIRVNNPTAEVAISHNTLVDNGTGTRSCSDSPGEPAAQIGVESASRVRVGNNILLATGRAGTIQVMVERQHVELRTNLYAGGAVPHLDHTGRRGDPLFLDLLARDFRVRPGSPAIDTASTLEEPAGPDHDGIARPQGAAADVGAYELCQP